MRVILFGATGMVGQGLLRECLADTGVEQVLVVLRKPAGLAASPKVTELVHGDFFDWTGIEESFAGYDTCFFALGVTAVGTPEADYRRITHDVPVAVAEMLLRVGGVRTLVHMSAYGASLQGKQNWARVKAETENALLAMAFEHVYCMRPFYIQPLDGIRSRTGIYNVIYGAFGWAYPLFKWMAPKYVTSTEELAKAIIGVARKGYGKRVLEVVDIHAVARL